MAYIIDRTYIKNWLDTLDKSTLEGIAAALELLAIEGPNLRRPLVDVIKNTSMANLKELRPPSSGRTEIRILFAFDPARQAIMLLGGDKSSGKNKWDKWYNKAIPQAEKIYAQHLASHGMTK